MHAPRVIHLVISLNHGGLERMVVSWANARNQRIPESTCVVCLDEAGDLAPAVDGDCVRVLQARRGRWPFDACAVWRLRAMLGKGGGRVVVHSHNLAAQQYAALGTLGSRVPHIHTAHGSLTVPRSATNALRNWIIRRGTTVTVAVSDVTAQQYARMVGGAVGRLEVVPNGIAPLPEVSSTEADALRQSLRLPAGAPVIGSIGRLAVIKGYDRLIRAFAGLGDRSPGGMPCFLLLVGDGPERDRLERLARELGVADRVRFTGFQAEAWRYLALMQLFVLPSLSEGLSVSLLEAMAAGVPVAVTDVGANREVIEEGACGMLLPADAAAWAAILPVPLVDRRSAEARAVSARRRVAACYSLQATLNAYEVLYAKAIRP